MHTIILPVVQDTNKHYVSNKCWVSIKRREGGLSSVQINVGGVY